jgi:hypothetical protein
LLYLIMGAVVSYYVPCGNWVNTIFGWDMWENNDPGGYYFASAHQVFSRRDLLYPGHPGLPLQILLHVIQKSYYWIRSLFGERLTFTGTVAHHIQSVFFLSSLAVCASHLFSFWLLYCLGKKLLRSERGALLGTWCYASSFPVLYYYWRISPEPLAVSCLLGMMLCLWRYRECVAQAERSSALTYAVYAGALAIGGVLSKFHLLFGSPVVGLLFVIVHSRSSSATAAFKPGFCALATLSFLMPVIGGFTLSTLIYDWTQFYAYWGAMEIGGFDLTMTNFFFEFSKRTIALLGKLFDNVPFQKWLPSATRSGIFLLCELPTILLGIIGAVLYSLGSPSHRKDLFWIAALLSFSIVAGLYRAIRSGDFHGFHYFIPALAFLALFAGHIFDCVIRQADSFRSEVGKLGLALVGILILHHTAIWAVLDSKTKDIANFQHRYRQLLQALPQAEQSQRIGILVPSGQYPTAMIHGLPNGEILLAVDRYFAVLNSRKSREELIAEMQAEQVTTVVEVSETYHTLGSPQKIKDWIKATEHLTETNGSNRDREL